MEAEDRIQCYLSKKKGHARHKTYWFTLLLSNACYKRLVNRKVPHFFIQVKQLKFKMSPLQWG